MKKYLLIALISVVARVSFAATWVVANSGSNFTPDSITITEGDTVLFNLQGTHNALEVSQATWIANGNTSNGGFNTPFGVSTVTGLTPGTYYYVCANHFSSGMKGRIFVQAALQPSVEFVVTSSSASEGAGSYNIALSITNPNSNPTTVDVNVAAGGSATYGSDFSFAPLMVTFPANSTFTQNVTINLTDDISAEGNESFTFQLNFPTNATIGTNSQHSVTIIDNDTLRFNIAQPSQSAAENAGVITVPVSLSNTSPNNTTVTVHLEATGTTATQGTDFSFNDTTLVWPAGSLGPILVPVTILDDTIFEGNETARFRLVNPTNGASFLNDTFQLVIQNNDTAPSGPCANLFFSQYLEGTSFNNAVEIFNPTALPVDLSQYKIFKSNDGGLSLWVYNLSGTVAPGATYLIANPTADPLITSVADDLTWFIDFNGNDALALLHFNDTIDIIGQLGTDPGTGWSLPNGGSTQDHTLIRNYYTYEGQTDWNVAATSWDVYPNGMYDSLGFHHTAPCGTPKPVYPSFVHLTVISDTVSENNGTVKVIAQIDNPNNTLVSYTLARHDNASTASAGLDYNFSNHNFITNHGGTTFDTVTITVLEDQLIEPTETAVLHFVNLSPGLSVLQDSVFTLYINDNDTLTVSYFGAGFSYVENDTLVPVKVVLSTFSTDTVLVNVTLAPGNATKGVDFIFNDTVLVFLPNSTDTQSAWIHLLADNLVEPNEQINFDLRDTVNGTRLGISAYTLTIIDNDVEVGMEEEDRYNFKVFPNPVINMLFIQTENELRNVDVTDLIGKVILHFEKLSAGKNSIDVSSLQPGFYFLNTCDKEKTISRRFAKQN